MTLHHILDKNTEEIDKIITRLSYGITPISYLFILAFCDAEGSINEESLDTHFLTNKFNKIREYIDEKDCLVKPRSFNVTLMIGVAGAGKDTWINEHLPDDIMLSRDNIRTEIGIKGEKPFGTKEQEKEVTRIFNERLLKCCKNKQDVVINNTNLLKKYRSEFVKMVLPYNPVINFVYVEPNEMEDCAIRRKGQIKKDIINGMWDRLEFPDPSECHTLFFSKQDKYGDEITSTINAKDIKY